MRHFGCLYISCIRCSYPMFFKGNAWGSFILCSKAFPWQSCPVCDRVVGSVTKLTLNRYRLFGTSIWDWHSSPLFYYMPTIKNSRLSLFQPNIISLEADWCGFHLGACCHNLDFRITFCSPSYFLSICL